MRVRVRDWTGLTQLEASFKAAQESFTLVTPSKDFVPPESQPWRFW